MGKGHQTVKEESPMGQREELIKIQRRYGPVVLYDDYIGRDPTYI